SEFDELAFARAELAAAEDLDLDGAAGEALERLLEAEREHVVVRLLVDHVREPKGGLRLRHAGYEERGQEDRQPSFHVRPPSIVPTRWRGALPELPCPSRRWSARADPHRCRAKPRCPKHRLPRLSIRTTAATRGTTPGRG